MGTGIGAFPYMIIFPQDEHERLLIEHLHAKAGVDCRARRWSSTGFDDHGDRVTALRLQRPDGSQQTWRPRCAGSSAATAPAPGCARSSGAEFPGGTYAHVSTSPTP